MNVEQEISVRNLIQVLDGEREPEQCDLFFNSVRDYLHEPEEVRSLLANPSHESRLVAVSAHNYRVRFWC